VRVEAGAAVHPSARLSAIPRGNANPDGEPELTDDAGEASESEMRTRDRATENTQKL